MSQLRSYDEINEKIKSGQAVVVTAEELIGLVAEKGWNSGSGGGCSHHRHLWPHVFIRGVF